MIVPSGANAGRSLARVSERGIRPDSLVLREHHRVAVAYRHRHDLIVEGAVLLRGDGPGMRHRGIGVLLGAGDLAQPDVVVGRRAHSQFVERAEQRVVRGGVDQRAVAVAVPAPRLRQQVGPVGHGLHAAGDHGVEFAVADQVVGGGDRVEPGQADLVDCQCGRRHRDAALYRCLSRGDLAGARLNDLAHDDVLGLLAGDAGAFQRSSDRQAAEFDGAEVLQGPQQLADRCPGATNDDRTWHVNPSLGCYERGVSPGPGVIARRAIRARRHCRVRRGPVERRRGGQAVRRGCCRR